MKKNKNVFLFGAGAVLSWGAPFTSELTDIVRKAGFSTTSGTMKITEFIYQELRNAGFGEKDVNFETIINVIEELMVYYASFDGRRKLPSLVQPFFTSTFENELLNYSIEGGVAKHGFKLEIPKGKRSDFAKSAVNDETPAQFFLQQLLAEIITDIVARISKYTSHTKNFTKVLTDENKVMNELFSSWMQTLHQQFAIRLYTLNYDRIFKIILEKSQRPITLFEGFDCADAIEYGSTLIADIPRILSDTQSDVHYNLHGSAFWQVTARDRSQLPNPYFTLSESPVLAVNSYEHGISQSERGKTIMLTNIITGYQKTQRAVFPPFKQMQTAFDRDCCFADIIYVIGYSFGDEHINASIKLAVQYNPNVRIVIIDPSFNKNEFDLHVAIKIFSSAGVSEEMHARTIGKNKHSFFDGKFIVYTKTFKEYLEEKTDWFDL